ncbi:MAG: hypothetical protein RLZZ316_431 [Bacteroidota bacterium]
MTNHCFAKRPFCLLLLFLFVIPFCVMSQSGQYNTTNWKFSNPKQFGFTPFDVDFIDNTTALAVGSDGGIAKSIDGGKNWTYGPFIFFNSAGVKTKTAFQDVHFVSSTIAYAVGSLGAMAKTIDGGVTWSFVTTPLYANARNINAVWFINKDTGYIGGQYNSIDSIPKLYFTRNGGASWDSLAAPVNGKSRAGYVANPSLQPFLLDVTAKDKEILKIIFVNDNLGYVSGSGLSTFERHPASPSGTTTTGAHHASMLWKFSNGTLTDYSLSKERLGYTGVNTTTVNTTTRYGSTQNATQNMRAMHIINDSTVLLMSFNNNIVVRVHTGKNDSTQNVAVPGLYEKGRYVTLNFPFPPNGGTPIPNPQVLLASNPYHISKASNGKLFAAGNFGALWTSLDTGKNWIRESSLPQGKNYSSNGTWAIDIAPNGRVLTLGTNGVVADSMPGGTWQSAYVSTPLSAGYNKIDFTDCNNGIAVGGGNITVTTDGGQNWIDKVRPDFVATFVNITGVTYPNLSKLYLTTNVGSIYQSPDKGTTLDPVYINGAFQMNDVTAIGNDTVWAVGYSAFSVPAASRKSSIFRSFNNGLSWQSFDIAVTTTTPAFTAPILSQMAFPSRTVGYVAGSRNGVYKTTDGGATWTNISPFPSVNFAPAGFPNASITYTEVFALDENTVFLTGNMFTNVGVKRVYKSIDGGSTWIDITGNITAILPVGNLNGILMHDANNGYVVAPGGALLKTTDGGASWILDIAPTNSLFNTMSFVPKKVPANIGMVNRKLFVTGASISGAPLMEYGNPADIAVNAAETITNATCTNPNGGSIIITASGGIAPYTYSIDGVNFQTTNSFNGLSQGAKTITIKDAYCGVLVKNITVGFTDNLTLTTNNDTLACAGAPVQMLATSAATNYSWSPATGLSNATISNPVARVNNNTVYTVTASLNGCVKTKVVTINVKPSPSVEAGSDKTIVTGDQVILEGSSSAATPVSIEWTPASSLSLANTFSPVARPNATTIYTLTVKDLNNCTATDNVTVTVVPNCIKVMNAFTPNGDGVNERWVVTTGGLCATQIKAVVFNRYGNIVYENTNYQNNWDGTYKGKPVADGTYYYTVTYRLLNGRDVIMKGDVTILR